MNTKKTSKKSKKKKSVPEVDSAEFDDTNLIPKDEVIMEIDDSRIEKL